MSGIDLHTHTRYSDGTFTPAESVAHARAIGLDVLAITDHDSTEGIAEALAAAEGTGLEIVPGTEFSTVHGHGGIHVLAYWPALGESEFQEELRRLRDDRFTRGERMVAKLRSLGHPISFDRVREIAAGKNIGRPHIAQALVEAGVVPTIDAAFTKELIDSGGKGYVEKHALPTLDAIALIKRSGAVAVLAHPVHWHGGIPIPDELIERMAEAGLDGIECAHPDHEPPVQERYRAMAARLGLVATGSSDCHGTRYDPVRMGCRTTDPAELERLRSRRR